MTCADLRTEDWLPVVGWEGRYWVSSHGNVQSRKKWLKPWLGSDGKLYVTLYWGGSKRHRMVHQLVLEAFRGARPEGMLGCHGPGGGLDNRLENLRWDTPSSNVLDAVSAGTHFQVKKTRCPHEHEYTPENTAIRSGRRRCRTCERKRVAA